MYNYFDEKTKNKEEITLMDIVALLDLLVKGLFEAEEKFFSNPRDLHSYRCFGSSVHFVSSEQHG